LGSGLARPEGPQPEARRAGVGLRFLERGTQSLPYQLVDLGEHCKLLQWGLGQIPG